MFSGILGPLPKLRLLLGQLLREQLLLSVLPLLVPALLLLVVY